MIITLLWFFVCHCEWGIPICKTWQYLHAIAILHFFPHTCQWQCCLTQISSSQLYHVRICRHNYHCLCFMIFLFWFQVSHFQMFSWILLSTLRLQLGCTQGGHVSAKSFGCLIPVLQLRFSRRFPLWHLKISCAPMFSKHTATSLHPTLLSIPLSVPTGVLWCFYSTFLELRHLA